MSVQHVYGCILWCYPFSFASNLFYVLHNHSYFYLRLSYALLMIISSLSALADM